MSHALFHKRFNSRQRFSLWNSTGRVLIALVVGACLAGSSAGIVNAQTYLESVGIPTFTTKLPVENGWIDASNGRLHLEIPLGSYPQRGGSVDNVALMYDSNIWTPITLSWQPTNISVSSGTAASWGGWRLVTSADPGHVSFGVSPCCRCLRDQSTGTQWTGWTWTAPDGTVHTFPVLTYEYTAGLCPHQTHPNSAGVAYDATGFYMSVTNYSTAVVHAPDGTEVYPTREDSNGNEFSGSAGNLVDTVGRTLVSTTTNGNTITYALPNAEGGTSNFTVTTESIPVATSFRQSGVTEYSGNITVIKSIQLPDTTSYSFTYDSGSQGNYGVLKSMTLPTGGTISYLFSPTLDAYGNTFDSILARDTPDGGGWSYALTPVNSCSSGQVNCQQQFSVIKAQSPNNDHIVYTFTLNGGSWGSQVQTYTGSISATNLVSTVSSCWNFVTVTNGQCTYNVTTSNPATEVTKAAITTTLPIPGSSISKTTEYTWDSNGYGELTQIAEWKFGNSPSNNADKTTNIGYLNGSNYISANILNRPSSIAVKDKIGHTDAQTSYSYDGSSLVSGAVGTCPAVTNSKNHDDTNFGTGNTVRGNVTQIQRVVGGSYTLSTSMTYDITGQVRTSADSNNNTTSYCYSDTFFKDVGNTSSPVSDNPSTATNAYLTTVTMPTVNQVTLTDSFGYYWGTGQRESRTDPNGNTMYSHFYDAMNRATSTAFPNLGWNYTVYNVSSGSNPTEAGVDTYTGIGVGTALTSSCPAQTTPTCRHDAITYDSAGLGRAGKRILASDPDGPTDIDATYDMNGRIATVSNPYRSTSDPTYGLETPFYDGLDRVVQVTHADSTIAYKYYGANVSGGSAGGTPTQNCSSSSYGVGYPVLVVDEAGNKRQTWTDGLGNVIETDEPSSSGSLTVGTCYSYDLNGNLTQITSPAVSPSQTRTYIYDMISRLTESINPETGTTCYFYTTASGTCGTSTTGSLCSGNPSAVCLRVAPLENQTNPANTVTTTYAYDALNRLGSKTYSDGTPGSYYYYDTPACPASNPKGHLINMGTYNGSAWLSGQCFSYDAMGNVITASPRVGTTNLAISYTYNLDGSPASITYPSNRTVSYTEGNAQRMGQAADTTNNINYVKAPSTGVMYAPTGALANALHGYVSGGFAGITESYTYNNRLEVTGIKATSSASTPLNLTYSYVTGNNGNIATQTNNASNGRSQTYTYDPLNRLLTAQTQATSGGDCWGQSFGNNGPPPTLAADALANLFYTTSIHQCNSPSPQYTMNTSNNNQFTGTGIGYDAAGNMTADTAFTYTYDAEGRIVSVSGISGGPYCYIYDAFGLRVEKALLQSGQTCYSTGSNAPTPVMEYWRSISGDTVAETDGTGSTSSTNPNYNEYIFFAGRRIAQSNPHLGNQYYYFVDHLGSTRAATDQNGNPCYEVDYLPYGTENTPANFTNGCSNPPTFRYRFMGYERDLETAYGTSAGNDYALARYYNSRLGRFMSGDPMGGDITDPQTLNKYAYVRDNAANLVDPSGLVPSIPARSQGTFAWTALDMAIVTSNGEGDSLVFLDAAAISFFASDGSGSAGAARAIAIKVLSGNNDCAKFFNSAPFIKSDPSNDPQFPTFATGADYLASDTIGENGHLALSQGGNTPYPGQGFGSEFFVNSKPGGAFLGSGNSQGLPGQTFGGVFQSGTLAAQVGIVLHELAHTLNLIGLDAGQDTASTDNNVTIAGKCATAILAAIAGVI